MIKNKKNLIFIIFIIILELTILIDSKTLVYSVNSAINIFINKLFISLFPFFILNKLLISYNLPYYVSKLKLFKINGKYLPIIMLSILTGMPSNAEYIKDYLKRNIINKEESERLLLITYFPSPVFVITVIGYLYFKSIKIGFIILFIIYLSNIILSLIIKKKNTSSYNKEYNIENKYVNLSYELKNSIISSFNSLIIILGNVIIFTILINIITNFLNLNDNKIAFISSILELTNGIKKISILNTNFSLKFALTIFALNFSGLSIHFQASSILSEYNINFKKIILYKLIYSSISFFAILLLVQIFKVFNIITF